MMCILHNVMWVLHRGALKIQSEFVNVTALDPWPLLPVLLQPEINYSRCKFAKLLRNSSVLPNNSASTAAMNTIPCKTVPSKLPDWE